VASSDQPGAYQLGNREPRDATPAPELEQSLVAEQAQRTQHGVRVDAEDGGEILRRREALSRLRLSLGDRPSNLSGDLFVQIRPSWRSSGVTVFMVFERSGQAQTASPALAAQPSRPAATASSRIAFITAVLKTHPNGGYLQAEVYVMNADGNGKRRLARNVRGVEALAWSPDGLRLAFQRSLGPTVGQCGVCNDEI
jgi:glucose/arabinose dehydrogenase